VAAIDSDEDHVGPYSCPGDPDDRVVHLAVAAVVVVFAVVCEAEVAENWAANSCQVARVDPDACLADRFASSDPSSSYRVVDLLAAAAAVFVVAASSFLAVVVVAAFVVAVAFEVVVVVVVVAGFGLAAELTVVAVF
jgi:hypothetical protein